MEARPVVPAPEVGRHRGRAARAAPATRARAAGRPPRTAPRRGSPRAAAPMGRRGPSPAAAASSAYCCVRQQRGVVRRMALGRQPPALDRVGEDDGRPVADRVGLGVAGEQRGEVVAAEVAERRQQLVVGEPGDVDLEPLAQLPRVRPQQPLVLLVGHLVDARPERRLLREPRPVLDHHAVPAGRLEHVAQASRGDVGHDAVERLAVEVDDPHHLAQPAAPSGRRPPPRSRPRRAPRRRSARSGGLRPARRSARRRSGGPARPRSARWRRGRPSPSSSRPGPGPWSARDRTAGRRTGAASPGSAGPGGRAGG